MATCLPFKGYQDLSRLFIQPFKPPRLQRLQRLQRLDTCSSGVHSVESLKSVEINNSIDFTTL